MSSNMPDTKNMVMPRVLYFQRGEEGKYIIVIPPREYEQCL